MKKVAAIKGLILFSLVLLKLPASSQERDYTQFYRTCSNAQDSARLDIASNTMRYHVYNEGEDNVTDRERELFDSLALNKYSVKIVRHMDMTTRCYNNLIKKHISDEMNLNESFWLSLNLEYDSLRNLEKSGG